MPHGCNGGHFCEGCPSVVLDSEAFDQLAEQAAKGREGAEYIILGLVDIEAIPASQSTIPLGSNENPIPLVSFTNLAAAEKDQDHPIGRKHLKRGTAKRKRRKKK